jgi:hypothetical protein
MFDLPCPLVWLPCFELLGRRASGPFTVHEHGSYYRFPMGEVLRGLPAAMQRFFISMLEHESGSSWLRSLAAPVNPGAVDRWGAVDRNMWCTAGFVHLAGLGATGNSYRFAPVQVTCDTEGRTRWQRGAGRPPRWKVEVTDTARYTAEMVGALRQLIGLVTAPGRA